MTASITPPIDHLPDDILEMLPELEHIVWS